MQNCASLHLFHSNGCFLFFPDDEAVVEVNIPGSESSEAILRKRTAGILDMGGVSTQIAYEVPKTVSFASSQQVAAVSSAGVLRLGGFCGQTGWLTKATRKMQSHATAERVFFSIFRGPG